MCRMKKHHRYRGMCVGVGHSINALNTRMIVRFDLKSCSLEGAVGGVRLWINPLLGYASLCGNVHNDSRCLKFCRMHVLAHLCCFGD